MAQQRDNSRQSEWDLYIAWRSLIADAAKRAQETHRERREQEPEEEKARIEAQAERAGDAAGAREERTDELKAERDEQDRRGIDPDAERIALAKERHRSSVIAREENLETMAADQSEAAISAAKQAAETSQEHAEERTAANDTQSAEYRALMEVRVDTAARMHEYRSERETEQVKIDEERRNAGALMARQARETRRIREKEEEVVATAPGLDAAKARALSALVSKPGGTAQKKSKRKIAAGTETSGPAGAGGPAEVGAEKSARRSLPASEELVEEARRMIETERGRAVPSKDAGEGPRDGDGFLRKMLRGLRLAA